MRAAGPAAGAAAAQRRLPRERPRSRTRGRGRGGGSGGDDSGPDANFNRDNGLQSGSGTPADCNPARPACSTASVARLTMNIWAH